MCGIAGCISRQQKTSIELLKKMTDSIAHRGPDGEGFWVNSSANVGLGHRRLSIIDLSDKAGQPMSYQNGRYTIIFNGEIYNYVELREQLIKRGYQFQNNSDTEVLLALYDEKKEKCLTELDGMFAFAVWDEKEQRLFCARDRFGEKPFYFAYYKDTLYFASEMKALWAAGVPKKVRGKMLFNYLAYGYVYNPRDLSETFYQDIFKLKAAHYFFVAPENLQIEQQKYWAIDYKKVDEQITESQAEDRFRELFYQSVKRRLRSDVPVGSSLSGGLDSSLIVCVIDELKKGTNNLQATFSARFRDFAKDEGKYMQLVIDQTEVDPHFVYPDDDGIQKDLETLFYHQEEPFGSASIYAQFCVMRLAKENNVTVLLDGQGADELLAGYLSYFYDYRRELKSRNKSLSKQELSAFLKLHSNGAAKIDWQQKAKSIASNSLPDPIKLKLSEIMWQKTLRQNFNQDFFEAYYEKSLIPQTFRPKSLAESLHASTFNGNLEELLRYADRNSMAHSREVRLPFLSHELAEFLFALPAKFKIRNGETKYIMRQAFARILPDEIINRHDKIGYEPPQKKWLESKLMADKIRTAGEHLTKMKIIDSNFTKNLLTKNNSQNTWKMLMAEITESGASIT
jgi:asparagine synthase (glutamine-hydrolysing)